MVLLNAMGATTETIFQQIYVQLLYITAFILIGIDIVILNLWLILNSICNHLNKNRRETENLKLLLEKLLPKEPIEEKHFWDKLTE
jgi:hypothetical protein